MFFCLLELVSSTTGITMDFLKRFPLSNEGLAWIFPAFAFGLIGSFVKEKANTL